MSLAVFDTSGGNLVVAVDTAGIFYAPADGEIDQFVELP